MEEQAVRTLLECIFVISVMTLYILIQYRTKKNGGIKLWDLFICKKCTHNDASFVRPFHGEMPVKPGGLAMTVIRCIDTFKLRWVPLTTSTR